MKRQTIVAVLVVSSLVLAAGVVRAATRNITSTLGGAKGDLFSLEGTMQVDSLKVGKQGTGGVTYFNGTIINNTTGTGGTNNPITFGDNVRIDGDVYRGATAGSSDTLPFKINDNVTIAGNLTVSGTVTASDYLKTKTYAGSFSISDSGDEVVTYNEHSNCSNPTDVKYTRYHWKKIVIPEVDLNNMPSIKSYNKLYDDFDIFPNLTDQWIEMGAYSLVAYTPGNVYVLYKYVEETCNGQENATPYVTGDYKIVVVYI